MSEWNNQPCRYPESFMYMELQDFMNMLEQFSLACVVRSEAHPFWVDHYNEVRDFNEGEFFDLYDKALHKDFSYKRK